VRHMLVDDPESIVAGGQNKRLAQLRQRAERTEAVQVGRGCSASIWAVAAMVASGMVRTA